MFVKFRGALVLMTILAAAILGVGSVLAQDAPASSLGDQLKAQYKLAKVALDAGGWSVVQPGTVLVIQKGGILGVPPANPTMAPATYKDGDLHAPNAFMVGMAGQNTRQLAVGKKVYVIKMDVHVKGDKVMLTIVECDVCNGVQQPSSFKSAVVFQFPKEYLSKADASQAKEVIDQVLAPDTAGQQDQARTQQQSQQQQPPEQPAPAPATIQMGQTIEQVKAALGQPEKIVDLGQKQIYVYKDLKTTFVNGKVSDVQ
jgi:hypothetical protein